MQLPIYPFFNLLLSQYPLMAYHIFLRWILVLAMEPFVSLRGLGLKFRVSFANQQNPTLLALSATTHIVQVVVSPEVVFGDARTKFLHPGTCDKWF